MDEIKVNFVYPERRSNIINKYNILHILLQRELTNTRNTFLLNVLNAWSISEGKVNCDTMLKGLERRSLFSKI